MIHTIDINAKEWFDKVNGNSYFAGTVTANYGMEDSQTFKMPFQYGYGDSYEDEAATVLDNAGVITLTKHANGSREPLYTYCKNNNIIVRRSKQKNCKKAELKNI